MSLRTLAVVCLGFVVCGCVASAGPQSDAFYSAIRDNDLAKLGAMLQQGADANTKDEHGVTPLMYAATAGSVEAMKLLIAKGADVNAKNMYGSTALMWSATDINKVRLLVEHGADVNAASKQGRTALLLAAFSDDSADIVRLLISKGADVKVADKVGMTALIAAAYGNDTGTVKLLIDSGDVNATAPLQGALADLGETPLLGAVFNGNLAAVKLLLAKGANVNGASSREKLFQVKNGSILLGGFTPLLLAVSFGPAEVVQTLLDAGADVKAKDVRGMTALMLAAASDRQDSAIIRTLLDKGVEVNAKSSLGETALDWARKTGIDSTIHMLKQAGAVESDAKTMPAVTVSPVDLRPAVVRSVGLLEKTTTQFFNNGGCVSCHAQNITDMAASLARTRNIAIDQAKAEERRKMVKAIFGSAAPFLLERMDAPGSPDTTAYSMVGVAAAEYAPDAMTDAMTANIAALQWKDGRWHYGGLARPPFEDGDIFRTAICIRGLKAYGPPGRGPEMKERIERASAWLVSAKPVTAEDRTMQLLGLHWAGRDASRQRGLAATILAKQRADGGWAQRDELQSDAYATGESLYALAEAGGVPASDAAYQKGVKYLLATQRADGSWYVRSRAPKFQPYFESSFPYGGDQWISTAATGWATMALSMALEETRAGVAERTVIARGR